MSRHKFEVIIDVDDAALAEHDGEQKSPPNDVSEWDVRDIFDAVREGIVDEGESEVSWYDGEVRETAPPPGDDEHGRRGD